MQRQDAEHTEYVSLGTGPLARSFICQICTSSAIEMNDFHIHQPPWGWILLFEFPMDCLNFLAVGGLGRDAVPPHYPS